MFINGKGFEAGYFATFEEAVAREKVMAERIQKAKSARPGKSKGKMARIS